MITMIVFVRRADNMSRDEYSEYWFTKHGPLAMSVPEFIRHNRKYVQFHVAEGEAEEGSLFGAISDFDGVGQVWYDSREAMHGAMAEPAYLKDIKPDEYNFINMAGCISFVGTEHVVYAAEGLED